MKRIVWLLQIAAFYLFTLAMSTIPEGRIRGTGRCMGLLMHRLLAGRRRIAIDNINQALAFMKRHPAWSCRYETAEEIARENFINLGISLVETCRLYHGKGNAIIDAIEMRGREHYERARSKNRGLIFVTGHCGNWELMALAFGRVFDDSMSVLARRQNNPYLNSMVEKMRMRYKNSVIYKQGSLRQIIGVIRKRGVIGILADQAVLRTEGVLVDVLGRRAWASKAPSIIAQKTGVPLVPAFIHREEGRHVITIWPEFVPSGDTSEEGVQRDVQALARYQEAFVCAHPQDWLWMHRRWKRAGEPGEPTPVLPGESQR
ncbi:lysophospholipid acyltransferase family protein [Pelobacter propionicus]|uniref:Lipid A biosynthesis acyltransferase n=1 Tax=Pelobacter propionicus (strain DSM 2379 / NBRC 103807 / OttBd1) TaxID=338966 RepID=A1ATF3_PELPD|nr:lysophospholipid acyltransferase family protein [Pelobacter propionicus]ABL00624.1 lipid A biosynthesis acyltransferase [Pelobacter propionicus DSM 2379]